MNELFLLVNKAVGAGVVQTVILLLALAESAFTHLLRLAVNCNQTWLANIFSKLMCKTIGLRISCQAIQARG